MLIHIGECFLRGHDDFLVGKSVAVGAAVRVFPFVRDDRQVGVGFLQIVQQRAEHIGKHVIVGIHESDVFAFGKVEPGVAGRRQAGIALAHRTNAVVTIRPSIALFAGGIGGSVVDQYDFQSFVGLPDKTFHALVEIPFHVADRHYHADEGLGRNCHKTCFQQLFTYFLPTNFAIRKPDPFLIQSTGSGLMIGISTYG